MLVIGWNASNHHKVGEVLIYEGLHQRDTLDVRQDSYSMESWNPSRFILPFAQRDMVREALKEVNPSPYKAELSHELIAGPTAWESTCLYTSMRLTKD
ncbi:hypothetical protein FRB97_004535 [Tulasnella sp. 331]|nr:hypothetical protein FRB97_004535 [Tulasnella sp. 331]